MEDEFQLWLGNHDSSKFGRAVLGWYRKHKRDLPWRKSPEAYRVWVSEIMLQQTRIETVVDYYDRFLKRFPDVHSLAAAKVDDVLSLWEGLGYYRRARSLHAAAKVVAEELGGCLPQDLAGLLKLPGIGRYTAGAILSIASNQRQPILEGNTIRLHARLAACPNDIDDSQVRKQMWEFAGAVMPSRSPGDFNQALMDIGSTICRPNDPDCKSCPVVNFCESFSRNCQAGIPYRESRVEYEVLRETALIVNRRNKFLVLQRSPDEWWSGLWDFPRVRLKPQSNSSRKFPSANDLRLAQSQLREQFGLVGTPRPIGFQLKHAVTKYRITLDCLEIKDVAGRLRTIGNCRWQSLGQIQELTLTASARRIVSRLTQNLKGQK